MRPRLIPVLTFDRRRRLVKTISFGERTYVGDPFNVIRLFNEKEVDEIVALDIDASVDRRAPDAGFIRELASECFVPLAYGGGLTNVRTCETLGRSGIEKFVIGTACRDRTFVKDMSRMFGSQAVVGCVDVRGSSDANSVFVKSGTETLDVGLKDYAKRLQDDGCGEIILQSIDRDGQRNGYDRNLIGQLSVVLGVPLIALGGAGTYENLCEALLCGASAAASASAFTFVGRLRAVLINYPSALDIDGFAKRLRGASRA